MVPVASVVQSVVQSVLERVKVGRSESKKLGEPSCYRNKLETCERVKIKEPDATSCTCGADSGESKRAK